MEERTIPSGRVLIVDDQPPNVLLLERMLRQAGFTNLRSSTNPHAVLSIFAEFQPDILLLDLHMPGLTGFEVMEQLKTVVADNVYFPILVLTADISTAMKQQALGCGAMDFLTKPFDVIEVVLRIKNLLKTRFLHLQLQDQNRTLEETVRERTREVREQAALIAKARDAILVCDLQTRIMFWNEGAERLYGWTSAEAMDRNAIELFRMAAEQFEEAGAATLAHGVWAGELVQHSRDGKEVIVMSRWTLIRNEAGQPRSNMVINTDITRKKSLEAQLFHAQRMEGIGMVAGGVAHDFNNLLTIINGYSEMVMSCMEPDDPSRGMLREVYKAGERAISLTRQLLAFSRKQILQVQVIDLNSLIADAEKMLSRLIGEDVKIVVDGDPHLGRVKADAGQIEQILLNLCVNARDAMAHGGQITVRTRNVELDERYAREHPYVKPGRYVELGVRDTGAGMDEVTKARLFEPFFTTKELGKGTGLGLATVYGIVKQSGGSIEFESAPGCGTLFQIYLPRVEEAVSTNRSSIDEFKAPRGAETILLVDDDAGVRSVTRLALQSFGYEVLDAGGGAAALLLSRAHLAPIHLLVTDVVMPGMSGRELADRLTPTRAGLKTLYLSGYTDDAVIRNGVAVGSASFLAKPITPGMLARKVRQVLDGCAETKIGTRSAS
jgi:two-component system, cell cycle sensor histidine kinase and response regulator CckA